jgi:hypothetical protein
VIDDVIKPFFYLIYIMSDNKVYRIEENDTMPELKPLIMLNDIELNEPSMSHNIESIRCTICLDSVSDKVFVELTCHKNHIYHSVCLSEWVRQRTTRKQEVNCPECRQKIDPRYLTNNLDDDNQRKVCCVIV